jgi:hypothetical protein
VRSSAKVVWVLKNNFWGEVVCWVLVLLSINRLVLTRITNHCFLLFAYTTMLVLNLDPISLSLFCSQLKALLYSHCYVPLSSIILNYVCLVTSFLALYLVCSSFIIIIIIIIVIIIIIIFNLFNIFIIFINNDMIYYYIKQLWVFIDI